MEHVTFDEFFDFVKNEDADWYIPGLKEYFEGLNPVSYTHLTLPTNSLV